MLERSDFPTYGAAAVEGGVGVDGHVLRVGEHPLQHALQL